MYIPLLSVARGHPPPHCENTQVLREAITEDDDDDDQIADKTAEPSTPVEPTEVNDQTPSKP